MNDRGHISLEYAMAIAAMAIVCVMWITLNEAVMSVNSVAVQLANQHQDLLSFMVTMWRLFPIILLIGIIGWAFWRAYKREPFTVVEEG